MEFSPDDRVLMSNAWDDTTRLWNPWSGRQLVRIDGYASQFSADGSRLALQQTGIRVGRWNLSDSDCCRALSWKTGDSGIFGADFHPTGKLLLLSTRGRLLLFETGEWNRIGEIPLRNSGFGRAAFSPDGSQIAVHDGEAIHLLRTDGLQTLARLQNPDAESYSRAGPEATTALAYSADQRFLASGTGGEQELLYVWDLAAVRQQLATVELDWDATPLSASPSPGMSIRHAPLQCLCPVGNSVTPARHKP